MKKIVILLTILTYNLVSAQTPTSIQVQDTRNTNDAPNFFAHGLRADFKTRATIGVPGTGTYSANLTIAPWNNADNSGGKNHQLNFNEDGIFYRNANPLDAQWGTWRQFLVTDVNGNVGIGTSAPQAKLEIFGNSTNATNLTLTANYIDKFRWRFNTTDRGNAIDLDFTASDHLDNQEAVLKLTRSTSGRPQFQLYNNNIVVNNNNVGIGTNAPQYKLDVRGTSYSTEHTIQSYSPLLILKRDTNLGVYTRIQTKALDGTDNWFFGNNQADTWIVSKGDFSHPKLTILDNGSVGIGAVDWQYLLNVNGKSSFNGNMRVNAKIEAKEIKVVNTPTADFVFAEDYVLPSLESVEKHIKEKKHLPEIASAKEMEKEGVNVGEFQIKLLQKIEELTLYTIEQNKKIAQLQNELKALSTKVNQ